MSAASAANQVNNLAQRLDAIDTVNGNNNNNALSTRDDEDAYYLANNMEPPRFAYYRMWRIAHCPKELKDKMTDSIDSFDCDNASITNDELEYSLKRNLIPTPEQRYQRRRKDWSFHDLSYLDQTVTVDEQGNKHYKDVVKDYGCGHWNNPKREGCWCVPECRYYPEYGRIEDEEIIKENNELRESYAKKNAIIDIELPPYDKMLQDIDESAL
jgi:hypothetical protein